MENNSYLERQFHRFLSPRIPTTGQKLVFGRLDPKKQKLEQVDVDCFSNYVSRKHAEVYFRDGSYYISDLGSFNGTFLNNVKLTPKTQYRLQINDRIGLGMAENNMQFVSEDASFFIFKFRQSQVLDVIDIASSDEENTTSVKRQKISDSTTDADADATDEECLVVQDKASVVISPLPRDISLASPPDAMPRHAIQENVAVAQKPNKPCPKRFKDRNDDKDIIKVNPKMQRTQAVLRNDTSDDETSLDSDDSDNIVPIRTVTIRKRKKDKHNKITAAETPMPAKEKKYYRVSVKSSSSSGSDLTNKSLPMSIGRKESNLRNSLDSNSSKENESIQPIRTNEASSVIRSPTPGTSKSRPNVADNISITDLSTEPDDDDEKFPSQPPEKSAIGRRAILLPSALPLPYPQIQKKWVKAVKIDAKKSTTENESKKNTLPSPTIKEKLKNVAIAESKPANDSLTHTSTPTHNAAQIRMRVSGGNRSDQLYASLMAVQNKQKQKPVESSVPSPPRREIPVLPFPTTHCQKKTSTSVIGKPIMQMTPPPAQSITKSPSLPLIDFTILSQNMFPLQSVESPFPAIASTSSGSRPKNVPLARVNPIEKSGITQTSLREQDTIVVDYHHTQPSYRPAATAATEIPAVSQIVDYHHTQTSYRPAAAAAASTEIPAIITEQPPAAILPEDEAHRTILKWNPNWLTEQRMKKAPPPVAGERKIVGATSEYADYKSYVDVYFPLILLEIWITISSDYNGGRITEFPISVDHCQLTNVCPMLNNCWSKVAQERSRFYTVVNCHTLTRSKTEISNRKDLSLATLGVDVKGSKGEEMHQYFAFVLHPETVVPLDGVVTVNPKLKEIVPNAAYKVSFQLVITSRYTIKKGFIGKLQKISYITPKLREVKALVQIPSSKLFDKVLKAQPPRIGWNPNAIVLQDLVIEKVVKLNTDQRTAVKYCSDLVLKSTDPELILIHGPKGTGKTTTIVGTVLQILLSEGRNLTNEAKRILLCSPNKTALDKLMLQLKEALKSLPNNGSESYLDKLQMLRVGDTDNKRLRKYTIDEKLKRQDSADSINRSTRESIEECKAEIRARKLAIEELNKTDDGLIESTILEMIDSLQKELKELKAKHQKLTTDLNNKTGDKGQSRQNILEQANIVCCTLNSCSQSLLTQAFGSLQSTKPKPFLCCLVDEASEATELETLTPLLLQVDKLILVGGPSHCQQGTTVLKKDAEMKRLKDSLFSLLYNNYTSHERDGRPLRQGSVVMLTQQYN